MFILRWIIFRLLIQLIFSLYQSIKPVIQSILSFHIPSEPHRTKPTISLGENIIFSCKICFTLCLTHSNRDSFVPIILRILAPTSINTTQALYNNKVSQILGNSHSLTFDAIFSCKFENGVSSQIIQVFVAVKMFQVIRENIDAVAGSVHAETRPVRLLVMSFVQLLISPTLGLIPSENGSKRPCCVTIAS